MKKILLMFLLAIVLPLALFLIYFMIGFSNGQPCNTSSIADSREAELFIAEYEFGEWSSAGKPIRFDEVWLEYECVLSYQMREKTQEYYFLIIKLHPSAPEPYEYLQGQGPEGRGVGILYADLDLVNESWETLRARTMSLRLGIAKESVRDSIWLYLVPDYFEREPILDSILLTKKAG